MGGKSKQAHRTKNNSRPSNSGRSAELLGSTLPPFSGFSTMEAGMLTTVPGFAGFDSVSDELDKNVDINFQLAIKKMMKKDPTTKIKGLQEFTDLVNATDVEVIKTILILWPRLYTHLATDVEHRVREGAQQAQAAVVAKMGKHIAPQLKDMAPAWVTSQFDTYAPAASVAANSFHMAFPQNKVQSVLAFCQNEILEYISANLTVHTPQTVCNPKSYTLDECEGKYHRVVICSLRGYSLYISTFAAELANGNMDKHRLIISSSKFWNFSKHKEAMIRAVWFEVMATILQHAVFLLGNFKQKLIDCVITNLNESDPLIIPHIWSNLLLIQNKIETWNSSINFEKNLLPKVYRMLKSGGGGNGPLIFPNIFPFISKFNKDILTETALLKFFIDIFDSYKIGLIQIGNTGRSEVSALSTSFYECLQYAMNQIRISNIIPDKNVEVELMKTFVDNYLIDIINFSFSVNSHNVKFIFGPMNSLFCQWTQNIEENRPIVAHFWEQLFELFVKSMANENLSTTLTAHYELLSTMRKGKSIKRNAKVTFGEEKSEVAIGKTQLVTTTGDSLYNLVLKVCQLYFKTMVVQKNDLLLIAAYNTLKLFHSEQLFYQLAKKDLNGFSKKLLNLLQFEQLCVEPMVDIILMVHNYLENTADSIALLNALLMYPDEKVQYWAFTRYLSHPLCNLPQMAAVLSQDAVTQMIKLCAESVVATTGSHEYLNLLHKCFYQTEDGKLLISNEATTAVCCVFMTVITNSARSTLIDTCASFLAHVMPIVCNDPEKLELQHALFLCLFKFSLSNSPSTDEQHDALWEVSTAWQDILTGDELKLEDPLLDDCVKLIHARLDMLPELGSEKCDEVADCVANLVICNIHKIPTDDRQEHANQMLKKIFDFPKFPQILKSSERIALILEAINGPMTSIVCHDNEVVDISDPVGKLESYAIMSAFKLAVIWKLIDPKMAGGHNPFYGFIDEDGNLVRKSSLKVPVEWVMEAAQSYAIYHTMTYKCAKLTTLTDELMLEGMERLALFCNEMNDDDLMSFKDGLLDRAEADGNTWAKAVFFLNDLRTFDGFKGLVEVCKDLLTAENKPTLMDVQILQAISGKVTSRALPIDNKLVSANTDLLIQICTIRVLIKNYYSAHFMDIEDKEILNISFRLINDISLLAKKDALGLLYNTNLNDKTNDQIQFTIEVINFIDDILRYFPRELDVKSWDFIRIAASSWVLTVSKAITCIKMVEVNQIKVSGFIASVYRLFATMSKFFENESSTSSTEMHAKILDEWNSLFAREVNILLLKGFMNVVSLDDFTDTGKYILDVICPTLVHIDTKYILQHFVDGTKSTFRSLFQFCLEGFSSDIHSVRIGCSTLIKKLSISVMEKDMEYFELNNKNNELHAENADQSWHLMSRFRNTIELHHAIIGTFFDDLHEDKIDLINSVSRQRHACLAFLQLWECILSIFANARAELRSYYARWIQQNKLEKFMLSALFELMPHTLTSKSFMLMDDKKLSQNDVQVCYFACHNYTQTLRYLPAVTRKWWQDLVPNTKSMVERITIDYVSAILCHEELATLNSKKENYDNMQITVHTSAREVKAVYTKDQARIELVISLPRNYPLGQIKVSCGKQVGGMVQADVLEMQLSIFLTHQNGLMLDGLSLWKNKLDRKFEGVEECYVCYSVIHQDTYQLPKQTCKTCKKKFHGPCLYQWFNTSNNSTCPICRNMF